MYTYIYIYIYICIHTWRAPARAHVVRRGTYHGSLNALNAPPAQGWPAYHRRSAAARWAVAGFQPDANKRA